MGRTAPDRQFGPYRLLSQLAIGGMAEIHLAAAKGFQGFEKVVALKMIHPNFSSDDHFVEMLVDEAKISVQLQHVNIAHVFDLGKVADTYYIAMEYVDGSDLFKVLRKTSERGRIMPIEAAVYVGKEVAAGLDYAHRKRDAGGRSMGIVHRDISPQNVLLSHAGEVKIVDFGIAKASMRVKQTAVGVIKGKYYYMSPEQAWGDPVDQRTDIFSAGILVYEMLTGQMLYLEEDMNRLLDMVRKADIAPPSSKRPEVPRELDRIVMRALAKKPDLRWQSAHDFGGALEEFLHGYAPDMSAQKLAAFVNEIVPPAPPPPTAVPAKADETARVTRGLAPSIMQSRSEFTDENSVLYKAGQVVPALAVDLPRPKRPRAEVTRPAVKRPPVTPDRVTTPAVLPAATMTIEETRAAPTLVSQPGFASVQGGTIELTPDMLEPMTSAGSTLPDVDRPAADTLPSPPPDTSDVTVTTHRPEPPAPRRSRRTPGSGLPVAVVSARHTAPLPLAPPPKDESVPARPVAVWPPPPFSDSPDADDEGFGVHIRRFNGKKIVIALLVVAIAVGVGAFAFAAFSGPGPASGDAAITVISIPQGARVFVDGKEVGQSPFKLEKLPVGKPVTLRLELDRYQPWQEVDPVKPGHTDVVASLRPIRGTLTVVSNPPGAEVVFGSRSLGTTPLVVTDMDPFVDGTVEVRMVGHRPSRQALSWAGSREKTLRFDLEASGN